MAPWLQSSGRGHCDHTYWGGPGNRLSKPVSLFHFITTSVQVSLYSDKGPNRSPVTKNSDRDPVPRTENFSVRIQAPRWSQSVGGWSQDYKGVYVKTGTYGRFNNNSIPLYSRGRGLRGRTTYSEKSKILKIDDRKLIILFHTIYKWILIWKRSTIK